MKPCIECGKECEILPVQLGDLFTLTYLRVCSAECMFLIAYEFMREEVIHKQFRNKLHDLEDKEDKKERDAYVKMITDESLKQMAQDFKENPLLLSHPVPNKIVEMFASKPTIPSCGSTVRFTRPKIEDRITWAKEHVDRMKQQLKDALKDLEKLENESSSS
jgi:hypothetical protein